MHTVLRTSGRLPTIRYSNRVAQEENGLLPVRRHRRRARAEARHLRAARQRPGGAHAPRLIRPPAERPNLREDRVAVLDDVDGGVVQDGAAGVGEEGVEVEHEGVHFDAPLRGRDELEGRGEVELFVRDLAQVEVLGEI